MDRLEFDSEKIHNYKDAYVKLINLLEEDLDGIRSANTFEDSLANSLARDEKQDALAVAVYIDAFLGGIITNISEFNHHALYNMSVFGTRLDNLLPLSPHVTLEGLVRTLVVLYRFYCEIIVVAPHITSMPSIEGLESLLQKMVENHKSLRDFRDQIVFIDKFMPASIVLHRMQSFELDKLKRVDVDLLGAVNLEAAAKFDFPKASEQLARGDALLGEFDGAERAIKKRMKILDAHKERIESYTASYNFVGLSKAFADMCVEKTKELARANRAQILLGIGLVLIPAFILLSIVFAPSSLNEHAAVVQSSGAGAPVVNLPVLPPTNPVEAVGPTAAADVIPVKSNSLVGVDEYYTNTASLASWVDDHYLKVGVPLLSIELILLYFFRVKLQEARSVSAQLLQINYRKYLCQFVQEYATYSKEITEKSPDLLQKFESVVFSPIVANESEIPSSFDGISQLAKLFENLKRPG